MIIEFTTDDIAIAIEIPGLYDGTAVYLLRDGTLVNRFRQSPGWPAAMIRRVDEWIANHGETCRKVNADMLDGGAACYLYAQINDEEHREGPVYEALKKAIEVLASLCHAIEADKMRRQIEDSVRQSAEAQERLTALESK